MDRFDLTYFKVVSNLKINFDLSQSTLLETFIASYLHSTYKTSV